MAQWLEPFLIRFFEDAEFTASSREECMAYLEARDMLTWNGSDLEQDIIQHALQQVDWPHILRLIKPSESDDEEDGYATSEVETDSESEE